MKVAKGFKLVSAALVLMLFASPVFADHCLIVYPDVPCIYAYDPSVYTVVGVGDPLYDETYDCNGCVLVEIATGEVDESIYQAPGLIGFQEWAGNAGYVFYGTDFTLIVDGWSTVPTTYENIKLVFDDFDPETCIPTIYIDGELLTNFMYPIGDLVVSTPTGGVGYSDTMSFEISWSGCYGLHIWAFADENNNNKRDGGECFTANAHDTTVPTEDASWGKIKVINQD